MTPIRPLASFSLGLALLASSPAAALTITVTSTVRSIEASAEAVVDADATTQRRGLWTSNVGAVVPNDPGMGILPASASASQSSQIPFSEFGENEFVVVLDASTHSAGLGGSSAESIFDVMFRTDEAVAFAIGSEFTTCGSVHFCAANVSLSGPGVDYFHGTGCCPGGFSAQNATGLLLPNQTYRLRASTNGSCAPFDPCGFGEVEVRLTVPEPGSGALALVGLAGLLHRGTRRRSFLDGPPSRSVSEAGSGRSAPRSGRPRPSSDS